MEHAGTGGPGRSRVWGWYEEGTGGPWQEQSVYSELQGKPPEELGQRP